MLGHPYIIMIIISVVISEAATLSEDEKRGITMIITSIIIGPSWQATLPEHEQLRKPACSHGWISAQAGG